ncbi:MAG: WD40 repeat domain-containing protein [Lachnospiraceae bacterium]|nr:WD40 repeat domain-containing protein [Lachnospiraceae bacterium]
MKWQKAIAKKERKNEEMKHNLESVDSQKIAQTMTNGMADYKLCLWVPEWLQDAEEKEYFVLKNTGTRQEKNWEELYHFTAEYIRGKCCYAISQDGKLALVGYAAKKGVVCYECENGKILWNNKNIKKIHEIRFNNFDYDIIEVISSKLEITYLDKYTGEVLEEEKIRQVRQVLNWMRSSQNGKYLIGADTVIGKDNAIYTVYDTENQMVKGRFAAQNHVGSSRSFDVADNGKFAVCSAYKRQGVSLINVDTGEVIWTQKKVKYIRAVSFHKGKVAVCCRNNGIYFLNIHSGEIDSHIQGEEIYLNAYGKDILLCEDNAAKIGKKKIKSPSFAFSEAIGIQNGVVLSPVGEGLMLYDNTGSLIWENNNIEIADIVYQEEENAIYGFNSIRGEGKIGIISAEDGQMISELAIEDYACAFIGDHKTLLCNTGKMYGVSKDNIKEKAEVFKFTVV